MSAGAELLRTLHAGPRPLILPNVWDAASARAFADAADLVEIRHTLRQIVNVTGD